MAEKDKDNFIEISVKGKSEALWPLLKDKLMATINNLLDTVVDQDSNSTIKDEAKEMAGLVVKYAKAKLKNPEIENNKLLAEIDNLYATKNKQIAETRKINAEAQAIELQNKIKSLILSLELSKVILVNSKDEQAIVFLKEVDGFINIMGKLKGLID